MSYGRGDDGAPGMWPRMIRGEPDYIGQIPRRLAYEAAHPHVEIIYLGPYWQAIIREGDGMTVITRHGLKQLLDKLEQMDPPASTRPDI